MTELGWFGKILIILGITTAGIGILLTLAGKIPWVGRLPGDIYIQKKNFTFYFPIATSVIVSVVLSIIFFLLRRK